MLSEEPLFALNSADLTESEEKVWNIGRFLPSIRCFLHTRGLNRLLSRCAPAQSVCKQLFCSWCERAVCALSPSKLSCTKTQHCCDHSPQLRTGTPGLVPMSILPVWIQHALQCPNPVFVPLCFVSSGVQHLARASNLASLLRRNNSAPFTLVLNLIVPGPPWRNLVMSWAADYSPSASSGGSHSRSHTPKTSLAGRCGFWGLG